MIITKATYKVFIKTLALTSMLGFASIYTYFLHSHGFSKRVKKMQWCKSGLFPAVLPPPAHAGPLHYNVTWEEEPWKHGGQQPGMHAHYVLHHTTT